MDGEEFLKMPMADFTALPQIEREAYELIYFLRPWETVDKTRTDIAIKQIQASSGDAYDRLISVYAVFKDDQAAEPLARQVWLAAMFALLTGKENPVSEEGGSVLTGLSDLTGGIGY